MDDPMKRWEMSTSHPRGLRVAAEDTNRTTEYAATTSMRTPKR
jgi:hypothetical protein